MICHAGTLANTEARFAVVISIFLVNRRIMEFFFTGYCQLSPPNKRELIID